MLADEVDYVIGVDTHRDEHTLAVVNAPAGAVVAETVVRANARGYAEAVRFSDRHARGQRRSQPSTSTGYGALRPRVLGRNCGT